MPTISPDSLRDIALTVDLGKGLTLIVIFGPGYLATDGLAEIREEVQSRGPVVEHRLDRLGPNIAETMASSEPGRPFVLVSGLERIVGDRRSQLLASMNLLRDTLNKQSASVILWIPSEAADEFRRLCVDLFHWRALTVYVDDPGSDDRRIRHAYLVSLASATMDSTVPVREVPELEVVVEGAAGPQGIDRWLDSVRRGVLLGFPGTGKTTALRRYCALRAENILDDVSSELPIFVAARRLHSGNHVQWQWRALTLAVSPELDDETSDWLAGQVDSVSAVLFVDGLDELPPDQRGAIDDRFLALVDGNPQLRIVVATRPIHNAIPGDWQEAEVQRLQPSATAAMLGSLGYDSVAIIDALEWANAEVLLTSPILWQLVAAHASPRGEGRELDLTAAIDALVMGRLGYWDEAREVPHRSTRSSADARRQLIALAGLSTGSSDLDSTTLDFLAERSGLIRKETGLGHSYTFAHDLLRDYFAAHGFSPDEFVARATDPTWRVATMHALRLLEPRLRLEKARDIWQASASEPPATRWTMRMLVLRAMLADRDLDVREHFIVQAKLALQQARRDGEPASAWTPVAELIERVDEP